MPIKILQTVIKRKDIISGLITMIVVEVGRRLVNKGLDKLENRNSNQQQEN